MYSLLLSPIHSFFMLCHCGRYCPHNTLLLVFYSLTYYFIILQTPRISDLSALRDNVKVKVNPEFNRIVNQSPLNEGTGLGCHNIIYSISPPTLYYSSGTPVVKRRDRMRREATWMPTDGHALAPPSSHLILTQLRGLVFERWGSSRPHSKQVARIWAKNSLTPKHTPASIWNSFHKEALNKSTLNYILNQEFAYLKLEAKTLAAKAARTHIKRAFVL